MSWKGAEAEVDGHPVAFHIECLREALGDPDMRGRIEPPEWWDRGAATVDGLSPAWRWLPRT